MVVVIVVASLSLCVVNFTRFSQHNAHFTGIVGKPNILLITNHFTIWACFSLYLYILLAGQVRVRVQVRIESWFASSPYEMKDQQGEQETEQNKCETMQTRGAQMSLKSALEALKVEGWLIGAWRTTHLVGRENSSSGGGCWVVLHRPRCCCGFQRRSWLRLDLTWIDRSLFTFANKSKHFWFANDADRAWNLPTNSNIL